MGRLAFASLAFVLNLQAFETAHVAPRFTVDLAINPEDRWANVTAAMKDGYVHVVSVVMSALIGRGLAPLLQAIEQSDGLARQLMPGDQYLELKGIARGLGADFSQLVVISQAYSLLAGCDSIVAQTDAGEIIHGRNLDFFWTPLLRSITIQVDFVLDGVTKFTAITFGPSPVFNNAVRYGVFSVTQDERDVGSSPEEAVARLASGRPSIFGLIRSAMESEAASSFDGAVRFFSDMQTPSSSYIILGGTRPGEGAVVTRSPTTVLDVWRLDASIGRWYVAETNYDHWTAPPPWDNRRLTIELAMNATGQKGVSPAVLFDVLSIRQVKSGSGETPPLGHDTVYTTIMQASNRSTFLTVVRSFVEGEAATVLV